ncbi:uncharacterized protein LOC122656313 [Telopea speciosissima]|uniref:uncharacterized protein LOC122656313 n=1 Tax=Telopea speciosissima TaxID=54955 RepID=UPI001CC55465|nr:uncharacterized protein LOC122656313 [Telopea speciosissima]
MISTERSIPMTDQPRRVLTPGASRKRKDREGLLQTDKSSTPTTSKINQIQDPDPNPNPTPAPTPVPSLSNRLLAGYMAHEFLTQGTLFGQKWDPAAATADKAETTKKVTKNKAVEEKGGREATAAAATGAAAHQSYAAVAKMMKVDGTHIPGIVNPTQLARWIQR